MAVALIDYGAGNLTSVRKGFAAAGIDLVVPNDVAALDDVRGIVVPGVGHFAATAALSADWREAILRRVEAGVPLLGICLGMQWLFHGSDEAPGQPGLGILAGTCRRLTASRPLKVPHVGWNTLEIHRRTSVLADVAASASVYFTHSYAAPVTPDTAASTTHGEAFAAVVERDHVIGIQFHPEKSGAAGLQILRNFAAMVKR